MNIVWFKKDLRVHDHRPLLEASHNGSCLGLFVIEDFWLQDPHFSNFHYQFAVDSLIELEEQLAQFNIPLLIVKGDIISSLKALKQTFDFKKLFSHEETGLDWTFQRDLKVKAWCKSNAITWKEYPQFGVKRPLKNRDQWNSLRNSILMRDLYPLPKSNSGQIDLSNIPQGIDLNKVQSNSSFSIQKGGRSAALNLLDSFLYKRGRIYHCSMSSPNTAYEHCSRISPHITWGTLCLSEVKHILELAKQKHSTNPSGQMNSNWFKSLRAFESRLWWHCHFIQKLESEPNIEFDNINSGFDGMREHNFNESYFEAWKKGETGYPLVDACMRALHQTGWINFRMRAMLISFASYHLWLHWKKPAEYLAQLFIDFEPGIHYSQVQMQSGVTGINAIRIYSPLKQTEDQDPLGTFIKQYCPELSALSAQELIAPHEVPPLSQEMYGIKIGKDYPAPIVGHKQAYTYAKETIFEWRQKAIVKELAKSVYNKHGSRKNKFFPKQTRKIFGN